MKPEDEVLLKKTSRITLVLLAALITISLALYQRASLKKTVDLYTAFIALDDLGNLPTLIDYSQTPSNYIKNIREKVEAQNPSVYKETRLLRQDIIDFLTREPVIGSQYRLEFSQRPLSGKSNDVKAVHTPFYFMDIDCRKYEAFDQESNAKNQTSNKPLRIQLKKLRALSTECIINTAVKVDPPLPVSVSPPQASSIDWSQPIIPNECEMFGNEHNCRCDVSNFIVRSRSSSEGRAFEGAAYDSRSGVIKFYLSDYPGMVEQRGELYFCPTVKVVSKSLGTVKPIDLICSNTIGRCDELSELAKNKKLISRTTDVYGNLNAKDAASLMRSQVTRAFDEIEFLGFKLPRKLSSVFILFFAVFSIFWFKSKEVILRDALRRNENLLEGFTNSILLSKQGWLGVTKLFPIAIIILSTTSLFVY